MSSPPEESEPLLPPSSHLSSASRSKLQARRYLSPSRPKSEKAKGKQRAADVDEEESYDHEEQELSDSNDESERPSRQDRGKGKAPEEPAQEQGRGITFIFSNEEKNLEVWVEEGESVGHVKEKIRHLRQSVAGYQLRLIHAGRMLTDGILLLPWLRSLEDRVRRQAAGVGADVGDVLRDVGLRELADGSRSSADAAPRAPPRKVYIHCNVGGPLNTPAVQSEETDTPPEQPAPRRRGFDVLLDAGLTPDDVAQMRRQFYGSRGEEVPDGIDAGDVNDEHARALEEQWIEGDLTAASATTYNEGMYSSILNGLLLGFLIPITPWFFFRDLPLPNFFDAEAEAAEQFRREEIAAREEDEQRAREHAAAMTGGNAVSADAGTASANAASTSSSGQASPAASNTLDHLEPPHPATPTPSETVSARVSSSPLVGGEAIPSVVFSKRVQIGIVLGTLINIVFGFLRMLG